MAHGHPASSTAIVDSEEALREIHRRLLEPTFAPDELVSADELIHAVRGGHSEVVALTRGGSTAAVAIVDRFGPAALLAYLAVSADARGQGYGTAVLDAALRHLDRRPQRPLVVIAEVERPGFHLADPGRGDPRRRLEFYARHGAQALDAPYFQPALGPGRARVPHMLLLALEVDRRLVDRDRLVDPRPVIGMLEAYLADTEGAARPQDPDAVALFAALEHPDGVLLRSPLHYLDAP